MSASTSPNQDDEAQQAFALMKTPNVPINFVPAKEGEILKLGHLTCRVMEDGSRTDNRIGTVEITIPAGSVGPPAHWHEMHDETFYVIQGTVRFHAPNGKIVDAKSGDYVTVPTRAPHTFSNPFDQEAKFINTLTPAFYVNYFKLLAEVSVKDKKMMKEKNLECMARYATVPAKELIQAIERGEN